MNFLKFKIIQTREEHSLETNLVDILFNVDHIVSVKPIKIVLSDGILNGYWIRLTNGKKYKATEIPNELKTGPDKKSWAITFSNTQPISVGFRNNQIVIAIQGQQFRDGKQLITEPIRIAATYNAEKTATGMRLQREGDVAVDFLARKKLTVLQVATKTVMSKKFNALFKDDIVGQGGIKLPGDWENAGNLMLQQLVANNGWLMLSYDLGKSSE